MFNIYPLNYKEFTDENNIKDYLHSVFDSIILRDVVERLGLKDIVLFNLLLQYVVDTTGREFSAENIIKYLKSEGKSISTETLYVYLDALWSHWGRFSCDIFKLKKYYYKIFIINVA